MNTINTRDIRNPIVEIEISYNNKRSQTKDNANSKDYNLNIINKKKDNENNNINDKNIINEINKSNPKQTKLSKYYIEELNYN